MGRPRNLTPRRRGPSRRDFLRRTGAAMLAIPLLDACGGKSDDNPGNTGTGGTTPPGGNQFLHGVASGDPLADAVLLWTRISPAGNAAVSVDYVVATDPALANVVRRGSASTDASRDYTAKVDVGGLQAGTSYY